MQTEKNEVMKKLLTLLFCLLMLSWACEKKPIVPDETAPESVVSGVYILNQGLWNMNNSTLSFYDFSTKHLTVDYFTAANGRGLGDTGNDLQLYGSKLYCVVNTSENILVINPSDCKVIQTVPLIGKSPRRICFYENKAYVSCFDGTVVRIDTGSLQVEASVNVGPNPEGVGVANGKLYVAISGGYNAPNYSKTVAVVTLNDFICSKQIEVVCNPMQIYVVNQQDVYVVSSGNYNGVPSCLQRINSIADEVVKTFDFPVQKMAFDGNLAYFYDADNAQVKVFDLQSETVVNESFISDGTAFSNLFEIAVNPNTHDVYISDAHQYTVNGDVFCFGIDGKKKFSFEAGLNPSCFVFL